jgi:putative transcriptional regulator
MKTPFFLKSTAALNDTFFEGATLFIAEVNEKGATGFVISQPFAKKLNDLAEFSASASFPLYDGGPVDREHLFVLHRRPDLVREGRPVGEGVYMGGKMTDIITAVDDNAITIADIRLFIGYCGWDPGELESEIEEGSWEIISGEHLF